MRGAGGAARIAGGRQPGAGAPECGAPAGPVAPWGRGREPPVRGPLGSTLAGMAAGEIRPSRRNRVAEMLKPPDPPQDRETALFLAARAGDRAAFSALVRAIAASSLALATRTLGNPALAEEAVQEALTKLWREAARFDPGRGGFRPWWRRILLHAALDSRRRLRILAPLAAAGDPADPAPGPAEHAEAAELDRRLAAAMARLPPRQRAALALFHGEGLTLAEVGDALGTSAKAVEGLLDRGRQALKAMLNGEME